MRLLGWAWMVILILVAMFTAEPEPDIPILVGAMLLGTAGTGLTLVAAKRGFLGEIWYVALDGAIALLLVSAGWLAGTDFISGGYPASWVFIVAFATNFRSTIVIGAIAAGRLRPSPPGDGSRPDEAVRECPVPGGGGGGRLGLRGTAGEGPASHPCRGGAGAGRGGPGAGEGTVDAARREVSDRSPAPRLCAADVEADQRHIGRSRRGSLPGPGPGEGSATDDQ